MLQNLRIFILLFFALNLNAQIIFLPQLHRSARFEHALSVMDLNNLELEEASIIEKLMGSGLDRALATRHAQADLKDREEVILSQFKIFHALKIISERNPEILVGEEACFFNAKSLSYLNDETGGYLSLGDNKYPIPKTYQTYLALRDKHPDEAPQFFHHDDQELKSASPFGIIDERYSFKYLDHLKEQKIIIPDNFHELTLKAKVYLGHAGGLSLAVSQGIIKNVAAIEDNQQEIHLFRQGIEVSPEDLDRRDLSLLRVYDFYLRLIKKYQLEFEQDYAELRAKRGPNASRESRMRSLVMAKMMSTQLFSAVRVFESKLKEKFAPFGTAYIKLATCRQEQEEEKVQEFITQTEDIYQQLEADFKKQKFQNLLEGRERSALARINELTKREELLPKDFVLIYGSGHNFRRYSTIEVPIVVPEMFWPDNQHALTGS